MTSLLFGNNFGYGGNNNPYSKMAAPANAGSSTPVAFQASPASSGVTSTSRFDTGRVEAMDANNPFAGVQGNLLAPAPSTALGVGRQLCITA